MEEPKIYKPSLEEIAHHESGHIVAGLLFYDIEGVTIESGTLMGMNTLGSAKITTPDEMYLGGAENEDQFENYLKIIICLMSGRYCQYRISNFDDRAGAFGDEEFLSLYLYSDKDTYYLPLSLLGSSITKDFCSDPRVIAMTNRLAEALIIKRTMNKSDIVILLEDLIFDSTELIRTLKQKYYRGFVIAWKKYLENQN